ncbi:peptidase M10A and M12B matrixin and adamalysin [Arthrobacter sp. 2RAF22]|uniref:peptidase M10A and M12B matrixin and adamalysin n=1 Tax=Arthrobacter sp. 2RAF22 TaxID=3232996 RepID=UPI003F8E5EE0
MEQMPGTAPAGWYPDPNGSTARHYWDGTDWIGLGEETPRHGPPAGAAVPAGPDSGPDSGLGEKRHGPDPAVPVRKYPSRARVLFISAVVAFSLAAVGAVINPPGMATMAVQGFAAGLAGSRPAAKDPASSSKATAAPMAKNPYYPTPGHEARRRPLGFPAPLPGKSDSYAFLPGGTAGQKFVAYDPCRPIHYVVRAANAPAGGLELVQAGFAELSRVTGLKFVYDGATQEAPSEKRKPYQPDVYGDRWAPVLVTWTSTEEYPIMASKETPEGKQLMVGLGGSSPVGIRDGRRVYVSGQISLNAPALADAAAYEGRTIYGSVIAHELAHLVGEDHVQDPEELMNPVTDGHLTGYAAGDLTGLAQLGQGPCAPEL